MNDSWSLRDSDRSSRNTRGGREGGENEREREMDNNAPEAAEEADMQNEILLPPVQHKYTQSNKTLSARAEVSIGHSFCSLSNNRPTASSKMSSPQSAL
jgi:hypothetical protein